MLRGGQEVEGKGAEEPPFFGVMGSLTGLLASSVFSEMKKVDVIVSQVMPG